MKADVAEICRRLETNDPSLTTLYMDFAWPPSDWLHLWKVSFPKNHTVGVLFITNLTAHRRLPRDAVPLVMAVAAANAAAKSSRNHSTDASASAHAAATAADAAAATAVAIVVASGAMPSSSQQMTEAAIGSTLQILQEFYEALAFAMEQHATLHTLYIAGFDIVPSFDVVVQAMKRKVAATTSQEQSQQQQQQPFQMSGLCGCHVMDHGVIRDLLSSNVLQSVNFHDCIFSTPATLEERFSLGIAISSFNQLNDDHDHDTSNVLEISSSSSSNNTLTTFMFQTELGPPPPYLMQDVVTYLQQQQPQQQPLLAPKLRENHHLLEELNIRCEAQDDDWWTLAQAFSSKRTTSITTDSTTTATTTVSPLVQRLKFGLHGTISVDIIQAIAFICCEASTSGCVKELDFSHGIFSVDALELLTLVLSRVPKPVVDTLTLTEITLDDDDDEDDDDGGGGMLRNTIYSTMGAMLVRKLTVQGIGLDSYNWAMFARGLALNTALEYLDVSGNDLGTEQVMALGQLLLDAAAAASRNSSSNNDGNKKNNRGMGLAKLKELRLEGVMAGDEGAEFLAQVVLQQPAAAAPARLEVLCIDNFGAAGLMAFARGLAHMPRLRKLTFGILVTEYTAEFFTALLQSLQVNRTLVELNMEGLELEKNDMPLKYMPIIKYWLSLNKAGRCLLGYDEANVPMGLWLHVLAKSAHDVDVLFYFVQENTRLWPYLVAAK